MPARGSFAVVAVASGLLVSALVASLSLGPAGDGPPDATPAHRARTSRRIEQAVAAVFAANVATPAPAEQRVALDPPAPPPRPDTAWLVLPRPRRDALPGLVRTPQHADAVRLLRCTTFNPRDLWLPEEARDAVASAIAATNTETRALAIALQAARDREFAELHGQGLTTPVQMGHHGRLLPLNEIGRNPVFGQMDGVTHVVGAARMRETRGLERELHAAGAALVDRLAGVFWVAGALTDEERSELAARARSEVGRLQ